MDQIERAQGSGKSAAEQQASAGENGGQQQGQQGGQQGGEQGGQQGGQQNGQQGGEQGGQQGGQQANAGQPGGDPRQGGSGSTNFEAPGGPGDQQQGGAIGARGTFVKIYDQKSTETRGKTEQTRGHINPLGTPSGSIDTLAQGDKTDSTVKTYEDVLPEARRRALDDLPNQPIPPQMKDLIRKYYDH
jgi:hypothetical protein